MKTVLRPVAFGLVAALLAGIMAWTMMIRMPGRSFRGSPPPLTPDEVQLRDELESHVRMLGETIGERNLPHHSRLVAAADYIEQTFREAGLAVRREGYAVRGVHSDNIEASIPGSAEVVVVGAHYDSVYGSPGANDNGSGVAALLALARKFAGQKPARTLRFVAFTNEEPPYFQTADMGSMVYAKNCRQRGDRVVAMLSLETIGYFSSGKGSQVYPLPGLSLAYPTRGNFIGFVSNPGSRHLLRQVMQVFRRHATIGSEGAALPAAVPGIGWSDQWAFWQHGYPGVMVTDTAPFRYPHYHERSDTPGQLDYESMARVVSALEKVVAELADVPGSP